MGHKNFNTSNPRVRTKKQRSSSRNSTKSGIKIKKKRSHLEICVNFQEFRGETTKNGLYYKICEKTVLTHKFWDDNQYLGSLGHRTALQWHQACYFFWGTILAWGEAQFSFGGAQVVIGEGTAPECPRGVGPAASLQQFIEL